MTQKEANALLRGKVVAGVRLRRFPAWAGRNESRKGQYATDPEIVFKDGTVLRFVTQETDIGEYGTALCIRAPEQGAKR